MFSMQSVQMSDMMIFIGSVHITVVPITMYGIPTLGPLPLAGGGGGCSHNPNPGGHGRISLQRPLTHKVLKGKQLSKIICYMQNFC